MIFVIHFINYMNVSFKVGKRHSLYIVNTQIILWMWLQTSEQQDKLVLLVNTT